MSDWFTTPIASSTEGLPRTTLALRPWVRTAAAVFSGCSGAVTRQAPEAGCRRQTVYDHARQVERRLQPPVPVLPPVEVPAPTPVAVLDDLTRRAWR